MNTSNIKPYVSKRKRNAQKQTIDNFHDCKKQHSEVDIKKIFLTDDTVYQSSLRNPKRNSFSRFVHRREKVTNSPLWNVKWCEKFSHILATTSKKSIKLFDVMKSNELECVFNSSSDGTDRIYKDLDWSKSSRQLIACSFDKMFEVWDFMNSGKQSLCVSLPEIPSVVRWSHEDDNMILVGGTNCYLASYDIRSGKKAVSYDSQFGNVLSVDFLEGTGSFVSSGDIVNRQSAQYSIIVWDFATGAKLSDQIFQERYSCPAVRVHPSGTSFLSQTNGNYIARFNSNKPYRLDKYLRYDQHKVEGYPVGFDLSRDGSIVVSGSSDGSVVFYKYTTGDVLKRIFLDENIQTQPLNIGDSNSSHDARHSSAVSVEFHPVLQSMVAVSDWSGNLFLLK